MAVDPYVRLSEVYDEGWGDFASDCAAFARDLIERHRLVPATILELACGTGTLAIELASDGHRVHGSDLSASMIARARTKAAGVPGLSFDIQDMADAAFLMTFDLALCEYDAINYLLTPQRIAGFFSTVSRALRPGGLLHFDFNRPLLYETFNNRTYERNMTDGVLVQKAAYDRASRLATTTFHFPNGEIEVHRQRAYELEDLERGMHDAGIEVVDLFGGFDRSPWTESTPRAICVCRKRGG